MFVQPLSHALLSAPAYMKTACCIPFPRCSSMTKQCFMHVADSPADPHPARESVFRAAGAQVQSPRLRDCVRDTLPLTPYVAYVHQAWPASCYTQKQNAIHMHTVACTVTVGERAHAHRALPLERALPPQTPQRATARHRGQNERGRVSRPSSDRGT